MTKRTVELAKNVVITVIAEYYCIHEEADLMADKFGYHSEGVKVSVDLDFDGKKYENGTVEELTTERLKQIMKAPEEAEMQIFWHDKNEPVKFFLKKENADNLKKAIESAKDEESPAEYKAKVKSKKAQEKEAEIKDLENLIAKCEDVIKANGNLKTKEEAEKWLRNYNNVMNEGGEGFLPRVYTQEEYLSAKKRLAELKA